MNRVTNIVWVVVWCCMIVIGFSSARAQITVPFTDPQHPPWKHLPDYPADDEIGNEGQPVQQYQVVPFVWHTGLSYSIDTLANFGLMANFGQSVIQSHPELPYASGLMIGTDSLNDVGARGDSLGQGFWYQLLFRKKAQQPGYGDSLYQNYPNPFNPLTYVPFTISSSLHQLRQVQVKIILTSVQGEDVVTLVDGLYSYGYYAILFDGTRLTSGVYIYHMEIDDYVNTIPVHSSYSRKMMFIR